VFLSDLDADPGETTSLASKLPGVTRELTEAATSWRGRIEERWAREAGARSRNLT
jgi:hypothetical protein